mmetsp:Transcript_138117/g.195500  ORF Transcript_138117/g.195500 Transcript_138117/m.195500 type:complete len:505 (-) Transcript_138117:108-1622(-)
MANRVVYIAVANYAYDQGENQLWSIVPNDVQALQDSFRRRFGANLIVVPAIKNVKAADMAGLKNRLMTAITAAVNLQPGDLLILSIHGHGGCQHGASYLSPVDANRDNLDVWSPHCRLKDVYLGAMQQVHPQGVCHLIWNVCRVQTFPNLNIQAMPCPGWNYHILMGCQDTVSAWGGNNWYTTGSSNIKVSNVIYAYTEALNDPVQFPTMEAVCRWTVSKVISLGPNGPETSPQVPEIWSTLISPPGGTFCFLGAVGQFLWGAVKPVVKEVLHGGLKGVGAAAQGLVNMGHQAVDSFSYSQDAQATQPNQVIHSFLLSQLVGASHRKQEPACYEHEMCDVTGETIPLGDKMVCVDEAGKSALSRLIFHLKGCNACQNATGSIECKFSSGSYVKAGSHVDSNPVTLQVPVPLPGLLKVHYGQSPTHDVGNVVGLEIFDASQQPICGFTSKDACKTMVYNTTGRVLTGFVYQVRDGDFIALAPVALKLECPKLLVDQVVSGGLTLE